MENHLGNLSALFFGQALDQIDQKCRYLAQIPSFGPNLAVFVPKILIFTGVNKSFGTHIMKTTQATCSHCFFGQALDQMGHEKLPIFIFPRYVFLAHRNTALSLVEQKSFWARLKSGGEGF